MSNQVYTAVERSRAPTGRCEPEPKEQQIQPPRSASRSTR